MPSILSKLDPNNPLHQEMTEAIRVGSLPKVKRLLDLGIPANAFGLERKHYANTGGVVYEATSLQTLLLTAISRKNHEMAVLLLEYGADPNQTPSSFRSRQRRSSRG